MTAYPTFLEAVALAEKTGESNIHNLKLMIEIADQNGLEIPIKPARKFKVGDQVRIIGELAAENENNEGEVTEDDGDPEDCMPYKVMDKYGWETWYNADELEVV